MSLHSLVFRIGFVLVFTGLMAVPNGPVPADPPPARDPKELAKIPP